MFLTLVWIPTEDQNFEEGCEVIDRNGNVHQYSATEEWRYVNEDAGWYKRNHMVAKPFLVKYEFNQRIIVGFPSSKVLKWLNANEKVKEADCSLIGDSGMDTLVVVKCPTCGGLH